MKIFNNSEQPEGSLVAKVVQFSPQEAKEYEVNTEYFLETDFIGQERITDDSQESIVILPFEKILIQTSCDWQHKNWSAEIRLVALEGADGAKITVQAERLDLLARKAQQAAIKQAIILAESIQRKGGNFPCR